MPKECQLWKQAQKIWGGCCPMQISVYVGESHDQPYGQMVLDQEMAVFDLSLSHKEGQPAVLSLHVGLKDFQACLKKMVRPMVCMVAMDREQTTTLFCGIYRPHFRLINEDMVCADFVAQKNPLLEDWPDIEKAYFSKPPFFDALFEAKTPKEHLSCRPVAFYWDRVTGKLSLSKIYGQGGTSLSTHDHELSFEQKSLPCAMEVKIQAQWVQKIQGFKNIYPFIESQFPEGKIHTLTGKALKKSWPKAGSSIGQSGYYVVHSQLQERSKDPHTLVKVFGEQKTMAIKKTWFEGELIVGYNYRQKRQETVCFVVKLGQSPQEPETLFWRLGRLPYLQDALPFLPQSFYAKETKICHDGKIFKARKDLITDSDFDEKEWEESEEELYQFQEDFFSTSRGQAVVAHGVERAKTALAWNSRKFLVRLRLPLEQGARFTLNDSLSLEDPRLPEGKILGKITEYDLTVKGATGETTLWLTLACGLKNKSARLVQSVSTTPQKIQKDEGGVMEKLKQPLEKVLIVNGPLDQTEYVKNLDPDPPLNSLQGHETRINLQFVSLLGRPCQESQVILDDQIFDPEQDAFNEGAHD